MPYSSITEDIVRRIEDAVGKDCIIQDPVKCKDYGQDAGEVIRTPELVVEPTEAEQIQRLLRLANEYHFPVTPRGLGTGVTGGSVPLLGGVVLSLIRMNRILSIEKENLIAVVEPGVVNLDLKNAVLNEGLFYPPDPASLDSCSIGGNAATNAGGPSCVKYGTTRDYVLGLEAVLPSGEKIAAGVRTRKGVVGYDLLHLLIGSEGTLGVITKLILKLLPLPKTLTTLVAFFPQLTSAMDAVTSILIQGHVPCAMEFLDNRCLELIGDLLPFEGTQRTGAFLLIETDGAPEVVEREIETIGDMCIQCGAVEVLLAPDSQKRTRMWEIRREVALRIEHESPVYIPEDVVVPIGRIAEFVSGLPEFEEKYDMKVYSFGHAGDGNIHLNVTTEDRDRRRIVDRGIEKILKRVISMGGTISGEHGIGAAKKRFLPLELSSESIRLQRDIKRLFDPHGILNPGKIFESGVS